MHTTPPRLVVGHDGFRAHTLEEPRPGRDVTLRLEQGVGLVVVPADLLVAQPDGSYTVPLGPDDLTRVGEAPDELARGGRVEVGKIPVVEESARIGKRVREAGQLVVYVTPHEHVQQVEVPLVEEHVEVRRVPVNQFIDGPVATRHEGNTTIVPVVEEVLVVEKRLMLREEVHVTRRRVETRQRQDVTLRREEARVLRAAGESPAS
jgi:uncharacterized protein (TIGR02271 family)